MKLRNKLAIITSAATLALVGAGFAAWTFTAETAPVDVSIAGKATAAIEANDLRVTDGAGHDVTNLYIICDAPTGKAGVIAGDGIYWAKDAEGDEPISTLTLIGSVTEDDNDIADINTYTGHFAGGALTAINGTYVEVAAASALDVNVVSASKNADVQTTYTLPALSYVEANIPTNVAGVNLLQAEVNAIDVTLSFTFNVASVA